MPSTTTTLTAAIGVPAFLLLLTHMKSLPLAYTVRSWLLLRKVIKRAKANKLEPECKVILKLIKINVAILILKVSYK